MIRMSTRLQNSNSCLITLKKITEAVTGSAEAVTRDVL